MHVVILSDLEASGGAAVAASRLASGLVRSGHQVTRVVHELCSGEREWTTYRLSPSRTIISRVAGRAMPARVRGSYEKRVSRNTLHKLLLSLNADVINVHNIHRAAHAGWDWEMLGVCERHAPVFWTLHDMWSFTGRCAYSYTCRRFIEGCDANCPTPWEYPELKPEQIAPAWQRRQQFVRAHPSVTVITPSQWMAQEARSGIWNYNRIVTIPYGIDLDVYKPIDKQIARRALRLDPDEHIIFAAAENLADRRKGAELLLLALKHTRQRPLTVLTMGSGGMTTALTNLKWHHLGQVSHPQLQVLAYSSADLFVHPAPVDNLPNVLIESLACGTPAVGFRTGGIPELVRPGQTGWLADDLSGVALAAAVDRAFGELAGGLNLSDSCRKVAEKEYPLSLQASRYIALFEETLGKANGSSSVGREFSKASSR